MSEAMQQAGWALAAADVWLLALLAMSTAVVLWRARWGWSGLCAGAGRRASVALVLCMIVGAFLRWTPSRWAHNVFDDEYIHAEMAAGLARHGVPALSDPLADCGPVREPPSWPPGYHVVFGTAYRLAGYSQRLSFALNAALGTLGIAAAFLAALAVFRAGAAAAATAALVALWPLHIKLSRGASTEILACLTLCLYGAAFALYAADPTRRNRAVAGQWAAWTGLMRPELIVFSVLGCMASYGIERRRGGGVGRVALSFLPCALPAAHAVFAAAHYSGQRAMIEGHTLVPALSYWFRGGLLYSPCITIAALAGAWVLSREGRRGALSGLLSLWLGYALIVGVYRRVDPNLGDLQRYYLLAGMAPTILAGGCVARLVRRRLALGAAGLGLLLACQAALLPRLSTPLSPMAVGREAQAEWLRAHRNLAPPNALVFTANPSFVWAVTGWTCAPMDCLSESSCWRGPVLLYRGFDVLPGGGGAMLRSTAPCGACELIGLDGTVRGRPLVPLARGRILGVDVSLSRLAE